MTEMLKKVASFAADGSACGSADPKEVPACGAADPAPSACGAADPAPACGAADPDKK